MKKIASSIAFHFVGLPYLWGGDDAVAGYDCSGLVIEILKSVGLLQRSGD
ncbi:NlpC/P60 family protein, partial [Candidatus Neomarinimicrobiota bacterium]